MIQYLVQKLYHRNVSAAELDTLLDANASLLVLLANGKPEHVHQPLSKPRKQTLAEQRTMWHEECAAGRVFVVWASRWEPADELPLQVAITLTEQPAEQATTPTT